MLEAKIDIAFAAFSDAAEISRMSRDEIEYGLQWSYTAEKLSRLMRDSTKNVVVARLDNMVIGFGIMTYHLDQANLDLLAVKPPFRRRKIASRLIAWLEKVAATAGCFDIFVQVREMNAGAIAFYEKLGFQPLGKMTGYYQTVENAVIMAKSLRTMYRGYTEVHKNSTIIKP